MLQELYQETILNHNRHPRNRGRFVGEAQHAEGYNPLCGDQVEIFVRVDAGRVAEIAFEGQGCAISTASASLMTEAVKGKTVEEAEAIFRTFQAMVTDTSGSEPDWDAMGDLAVLAGVRELPVRIKCATLAWHTLYAALRQESEATTE